MLSEKTERTDSNTGLGTKASSPELNGGGAEPKLIHDFVIGMYPASIIIGAGLLSLPSTSAYIGVLPLVLTLLVFAFWMIFMYRRLANSLFDVLRQAVQVNGNGYVTEEAIQHEASKRGKYQVMEALRDLRLGKAGQTALVLGMALYVIPADIGYLIVGSRSLNAIAVSLFATSIPAIGVGILAALICLIALNFERVFPRPFLLRGTLKKILMMGSAWLAGIAILLALMQANVVPDVSFVSNLGLVLFTAAILAAMYTRSPEAVSATLDTQQTILRDDHKVNVFVVGLEIALIVITAVLVFVVASQHELLQPIIWISPMTFSLEAAQPWANLIGVVIFAYVGTGIFNLCSYPALFNKSGKQSPRLTRIVIIGTLIPLVVYLLWSLISVLVLPTNVLLELDQAKEYSTIGIARILSPVDPFSAWLITFLGYTVALMAVTAACQGFTESLADTFNAVIRRNDHSQGERPNHLRIVVLLGALLCAFFLNNRQALNLSDLLAVSGTAGGGLLLLILPWFLPANGRRKSTWGSIMIAMMSAFILTVLALIAINLNAVHDFGGFVVAGITIVIALSIFGIAIWLIASEPEA